MQCRKYLQRHKYLQRRKHLQLRKYSQRWKCLQRRRYLQRCKYPQSDQCFFTFCDTRVIAAFGCWTLHWTSCPQPFGSLRPLYMCTVHYRFKCFLPKNWRTHFTDSRTHRQAAPNYLLDVLIDWSTFTGLVKPTLEVSSLSLVFPNAYFSYWFWKNTTYLQPRLPKFKM